MRATVALVLCVAAAAGSTDHNPDALRIVGGSLTTIEAYPSIAALLIAIGMTGFSRCCGGNILNNRSILTAAHCLSDIATPNIQVRLGSTFANSGGTVYTTAMVITHPSYNIPVSWNNDLSILRLSFSISFGNAVQPATIAGPNYNLADNELVWAAGWGRISDGGPPSEQLRHVPIWTVNQIACRDNYVNVRINITDNMLCAGWFGIGGIGQCNMDTGGPLYHNGILVGVYSFSNACARPDYPGVNVRLSRYTDWIQANA